MKLQNEPVWEELEKLRNQKNQQDQRKAALENEIESIKARQTSLESELCEGELKNLDSEVPLYFCIN